MDLSDFDRLNEVSCSVGRALAKLPADQQKLYAEAEAIEGYTNKTLLRWLVENNTGINPNSRVLQHRLRRCGCFDAS